MVEPVDEYLQRDLRCIDLLECFHGLNRRDKAVFRLLYDVDGGLTVDAVAERVDCERSTAYRSISRLIDADVVSQRQVNYDRGGYYYVYRTRDASDIADDMRRILSEWYTSVSTLVQDFEATYARIQRDDVCPIPLDQ
ncbi:helix-turn-helix domain-containing protein [Halosimplex amylolyticum]|uniref:helix-turn-helix domain-containing protein n=1 Tax=Halosimplex amylolyticum TaxID=3396616 RepID=UPI003F548EDA